jgi:hypothetical protein
VNKRYIGDGVYVEPEGDMIKLTTEVGDGVPTNVIFLEYEVCTSLVEYVQEWLNEIKGEQK